MKKTLTIIILLILLISLIFNAYFICSLENEIIKVECLKDTIIKTVVNYDTVYIKNTKYKNIYKYDTVVVNNTVYVKDSVHNYSFFEKDYDLSIDAVKLDNYKLNIHTQDTVSYIQTNFIKKTKNKQRISFGIQAGYGVTLKSKQFEPYLGVGLSYKIF